MGIIDSNRFILSCSTCATEEAAVVHQKGSAYGASWQHGQELKRFQVEWKDRGAAGPTITSATCRKCGMTATVKQSA